MMTHPDGRHEYNLSSRMPMDHNVQLAVTNQAGSSKGKKQKQTPSQGGNKGKEELDRIIQRSVDVEREAERRTDHERSRGSFRGR